MNALVQSLETFSFDFLQDSHLRFLDLACGSGEATLALRIWQNRFHPELKISEHACDPFTQLAFQERVGLEAKHWGFEDIARGVLGDRVQFDLVICSFALHLLDSSRMYSTMTALAQAARVLVVVSPHKKPEMKPEWGWQLVQQTLIERIHVRIFKSSFK